MISQAKARVDYLEDIVETLLSTFGKLETLIPGDSQTIPRDKTEEFINMRIKAIQNELNERNFR